MNIVEGIYGFLWNSAASNNCNCYLINGPARVLIDPGHAGLVDHVETRLKQLGLGFQDMDLVICTHAHPDHLEAVRLFTGTPTLFAMGENDWRIVEEMGKQLGTSLEIEAYTPDFFLQEGDFHMKGLRLEIIETPGHSPGSISLYMPSKKALFTGDVIFKGGLGRTDLPGGDGGALKESIKRLSELDVEWMFPGHGEIISGAEEVRSNFARVEQFFFAYI